MPDVNVNRANKRNINSNSVEEQLGIDAILFCSINVKSFKYDK